MTQTLLTELINPPEKLSGKYEYTITALFGGVSGRIGRINQNQYLVNLGSAYVGQMNGVEFIESAIQNIENINNINDINQKIEDMNKQIEDMNKQIEDMNKQIEDMNKQIEDMNEKLDKKS